MSQGNGKPIIDVALAYLKRGFWPVAIYARGEEIEGKIKEGKEPIGGAWGLNRWSESKLRGKLAEHPGRGLGFGLGPERGPNGDWLIDLEGDGPQAQESLERLLGDNAETMGWDATRGSHNLHTADGERLLQLLEAAGAEQGKGLKAGVWHLAQLPDLEFRVGGFKEGGTVKQIQSVVPPTPGTNGEPRKWNGVEDVAELPEAAYAFLESLAERRAIQAAENEPTNGGGKPEGKALAGPMTVKATSGGGADVEARAVAYLARCDPAISGQGGHKQTFGVACRVGPGFDLDEKTALRLLRDEYNPRCQPPWSEAELKHKVEDAYKSETDRGWLVNGQSSTSTSTPKAIAIADLPIIRHRRWASCVHNSLIWLRQHGYGSTTRYDQFRQVILIGGKPLDDEIVIALTAEIESTQRTTWCLEHVRSALIKTAHQNEYSSLTEWLDSLKWDGKPRLLKFFRDAYGCQLTRYTAACAKVLFISAVARAYRPGCQADVMVVLIGKQGLGKSMGIAALCPDPTWYADDLGADLGDRKPGEGLRGKWLIEFSEFSRINRATLDVVKSFLTRRSDYYRPAYGRTHKDFPRTCIFVGTTNDDHPLHDVENRRYMPIQCVQVNHEWIAGNRDQLWAEAVSLFRAGAKWWVTVPIVLKDVAQKQAEARQSDAWVELLDKGLFGKAEITMGDAAEALKIDIARLDRSTQTRIGLALKQLKYVRGRARDGDELFYVWRK